MNSKVILLLGLLAFSAFSAGVPDAATSAKLLALHNADRSEVGLSSLSWSSSLASSAQDWANNLAANGGLKHSGTKGVGENLAKASFRNNLIEFLYGMWSGEKKDFTNSKPFPDCSTTGNWQDVAHYTQIMWAKTSQVGCGIANTTASSVLVCHYKVAGNYREEYVWTSSDIVNDNSGSDAEPEPEPEPEETEEAETTTPSDDSNEENNDSQDNSSEEVPADNSNNDNSQDNTDEETPANNNNNDDSSNDNASDNDNNDDEDDDSDSTEAETPKPTKKTYHYSASKGLKKTYTRAFKSN